MYTSDVIVIGLGGNTGPVPAVLLGACRRLEAVRRSSFWSSAPVGPVADQPDFINACAELRWEGSPRALLERLLDVERELGRDRARERPQGPRPIDLDLLLFDDRVIGEPDLIVPHPRLHERAFALAPLVELAGPDLVIPGRGRAGDLLAAALSDPRQRVVRWTSS
jgi:2-amino-4-hydroxy-6-hydroxymethyldihydropteridine diphosphokinase